MALESTDSRLKFILTWLLIVRISRTLLVDVLAVKGQEGVHPDDRVSVPQGYFNGKRRAEQAVLTK